MDPVTGLSLGRIVIGVGSIVAPAATARMFGLSPAANPQLGYFARMFGVREVAFGALTLVSRGRARRTMVLAGVAVDGGDAVTGAIALSRKEVSALSGGMLIAVALGAAASGAVALQQDRGSDSPA